MHGSSPEDNRPAESNLSLNVIDSIKALTLKLDANCHRCCFVITGEEYWCCDIVDQILDLFIEKNIHWVSKKPPQHANVIDPTKIQTFLGEETDVIVFDAHSGFNPDAFAAVSGLIRGGGILFLLAPSLVKWKDFLDPEYQRISVFPVKPSEMTGRFLCRFSKVIQNHSSTIIFEQTQVPPEISCHIKEVKENEVRRIMDKKKCDPIFRTEDQKCAVDAIIKVAKGHRNRPLVITSDRGRGKSTALGIAAAELIKNDLEKIIVTAPRLDATNLLFDQAEKLLSEKECSRGQIKTSHSLLKFYSPDELLRSDQKTTLLLVDEAAAIPAPILEKLLLRFSRIVFATTIHGYEGTGRGFAVRFKKTLDQKTPNWKEIEMKTPIRWAENDPLEELVFNSLLLDAAPAKKELIENFRVSDCSVQLLNREALMEDENLLRQTFGLLINAHYQTRPSDLRYLMDGPNLSVFVIQKSGQVIATALLAREGGFDQKLATEITKGKRRPHGHLIPETLASHMGLKQAPLLTGGRIVRIAVHPTLQHKGFGTWLLEEIKNHSSNKDLDYLAASFGATAELLSFWKRSEYVHIRIGVKRNASSGEHSAVVFKPNSTAGKEIFTQARHRFSKQFPHQLSESLSSLESELVIFLLQQNQNKEFRLDELDYDDINAFIKNERIYEECSVSIWNCLISNFSNGKNIESLSFDQKEILVKKVLQKRPWNVVGRVGKKAALKTLRESLQILIS
ncbi:MAG: tRNA(Met) cytidine acetyltransferase TmcA [Gammaproteobacteria bacterium]